MGVSDRMENASLGPLLLSLRARPVWPPYHAGRSMSGGVRAGARLLAAPLAGRLRRVRWCLRAGSSPFAWTCRATSAVTASCKKPAGRLPLRRHSAARPARAYGGGLARSFCAPSTRARARPTPTTATGATARFASPCGRIRSKVPLAAMRMLPRASPARLGPADGGIVQGGAIRGNAAGLPAPHGPSTDFTLRQCDVNAVMRATARRFAPLFIEKAAPELSGNDPARPHG